MEFIEITKGLLALAGAVVALLVFIIFPRSPSGNTRRGSTRPTVSLFRAVLILLLAVWLLGLFVAWILKKG